MFLYVLCKFQRRQTVFVTLRYICNVYFDQQLTIDFAPYYRVSHSTDHRDYLEQHMSQITMGLIGSVSEIYQLPTLIQQSVLVSTQLTILGYVTEYQIPFNVQVICNLKHTNCTTELSWHQIIPTCEFAHKYLLVCKQIVIYSQR